VFINPDLGAGPLEEFLGELPGHFDRWHLEDRYVQAHVGRVMSCNWKVCIEAFSEGYHVNATHPQGMAYVSDPIGQVDVYGNFARQISPSGVPSPFLQWEPTQEEIMRAMLDLREGEPLPVELPPGTTAREAMANAARARWRPVIGDQVDQLTDAEFVDHFNYSVFPNIHPWGAFNRICYRFRPNGDDHTTCLFEIFFIAPFTGDRPDPAPFHLLEPDEPWTSAAELDSLGMVIEQDSFNVPHVQRGMKMLRKSGASLARYQESMIRWRHDLIAAYIEGTAP
jgi:hypothetical protein